MPQPQSYKSAQSNGTFSYVYQYKDHLGNVRLSYCDANKDGIVALTEVIEEDHYYAFGMKHKGYGPAVTSTIIGQKVKCNSMELQDELDLNWYDYMARNYDPALGRWFNIDPLAEKSRRFSPYTYCLNNPVYFIDPDGMEATPGDFINESGKKVGTDGIADGKMYVIKTTKTKVDSGVKVDGITKAQAKATEQFIKDNDGNTAAFKENSIEYDNSIEYEGNTENRQMMVDEVKNDNGRGGTSEANNREYGGRKSDGAIVTVPPGPVANPLTDGYATIDLGASPGEDTFHGHCSGTVGDKHEPNTVQYGPRNKASYMQSPSQPDINNAKFAGPGTTHYVFARGENRVYIYNGDGVQATLPHNSFVTPK